MPICARPLHFSAAAALVALILAHAGTAELPLPPRTHYERCWEVLEGLCEDDGSEACGQLVKLCGQLLTEHLTVAHRPGESRPNCSSERAAPKMRLQKRRRYLDELPRASFTNSNATSVLLSQKIAPLAETPTGARKMRRSAENSGKERAGHHSAVSTRAKTAIDPTKGKTATESVGATASTGRRGLELRGMLPADQTQSYDIPLEKRTGQRPSNRPRPAYGSTPPRGPPAAPYGPSVRAYRVSFLQGKGDLMVEWLASNKPAFREFLQFWKNLMLYQKHVKPSLANKHNG